MKRKSQLSTRAWLLRGIHSVPGRLQAAGGRLSFTTFGSGNLRPGQLRKLERDGGRDGLAARLGTEEKVQVFSVPLSEVQDVVFPWYYFSGGVKLTVEGVRYRFAFEQPSNTKISSEGGDLIGEFSRARRSGRAWKAVLVGRP